MRLLRVLAVAVLLGASGCGKGGTVSGPSSGGPAPSTPSSYNPLPADRIFGTYLYDGNRIEEVCSTYNWALLYNITEAHAEETAATAARCRIQVTWTPFLGEATSGSAKLWDDRWETNKRFIRIFERAGVLHSVYVADEPMAAKQHAFTYGELARRIAMVRAEGWKAWFTEELGGIDAAHPDVDYFGLDGYYLHEGAPHPILDDAIRRNPKVTVYVGYSFFNKARRPACRSHYDMPDQHSQAAFARSHRLGFASWTWIDFAGGSGCQYTGVGNHPETQAVHRALFAQW